MVRPRKCRRVCGLPGINSFGPLDAEERGILPVSMTVEEYESIRLIDLDSKTQQECAEVMGVARTTVQSIYDSARKKIADALVNGKQLRIEGGNYELCGEHHGRCNNWQECPKRAIAVCEPRRCQRRNKGGQTDENCITRK